MKRRIIAILMFFCLLGTLYPAAVVQADPTDTDPEEAPFTVELSETSYVFCNEECKPEVTVSMEAAELEEGVDYEITYPEDMVNAGKKEITVTGSEQFPGTKTAEYEITAKEETEETILVTLDQDTFVFTGEEQKPEVLSVATSLEESLDPEEYEVTFPNESVDAGAYSLTVTLKGNYSGSRDCAYEITPASILPTKDTAVLEPAVFDYDGNECKPSVTLKMGEKELEPGEDFTVEYTNNIKPGEATATITGIGNYKDSYPLSFLIQDSSLSVALSQGSFVFSNAEQKPTVTVYDSAQQLLTQGEDYTVSYSEKADGTGTNLTDAGTKYVTVTGLGVYQNAKKTESYTITPKAVTPTITLDKNPLPFNGKNQRPAVSVGTGLEAKLDPSEYDVEYPESSVKVGQYSLKVTLKGNYTGSATASYEIVQESILVTKDSAVLSPSTYMYDGEKCTPTVTLTLNGYTLVLNQDYKVSYSDNRYPGIATATVKGIKGFKDEFTLEFTIQDTFTVELSSDSFVFTNEVKVPKNVIVKNTAGRRMTEGTDYTVVYPENMIDVGKKTIKVIGKGVYVGTKSASYKITPNTNNPPIVTLDTKEFVYNGTTQRAKVVSVGTAKEAVLDPSEYDVEYLDKSSVDAGQYTIRVTLKGNYSASKDYYYYIQAAFLYDTKDTAVITPFTFTYTGSKCVPSLTLKMNGKTLKKGKDYKVSCSNNVNPGVATATVQGIGNYKGSYSVSFLIRKAKQNLKAKVTKKSFAVKYNTLKNKDLTLYRKDTYKVSGTIGKVTYKGYTKSSFIKVDSAGDIQILKGINKGTYNIKIQVTGEGDTYHLKTNRIVPITIKVK